MLHRAVRIIVLGIFVAAILTIGLIAMLRLYREQGVIEVVESKFVDPAEASFASDATQSAIVPCRNIDMSCLVIELRSPKDLCELTREHRGGIEAEVFPCVGSKEEFPVGSSMIGLDNIFSYNFFYQCERDKPAEGDSIQAYFQFSIEGRMSDDLSAFEVVSTILESGNLCLSLGIAPYWGQFGWESNVVKVPALSARE